jgi:hypothetical protein
MKMKGISIVYDLLLFSSRSHKFDRRDLVLLSCLFLNIFDVIMNNIIFLIFFSASHYWYEEKLLI